jgi:SPP1 gp7 family putative phage head morphogenesis protein
LPPGFDVIFAQMQTGADVTPLLDYFDRQQLRNFGVPRSVLGEVVSGDRSSAETNQYVMDLHTITPLTQIIADALTQQLAPDFDVKLKVRFGPFVAADKAHELAKQQADLSLKVRSINEVRTLAGEDPVEWGEYPVGSFADIPYTGEEREPMGGVGDPSALEDDDDDEPTEKDDQPEDEPRRRDAEKSALSPTYSIAQRERWVSQYGSAMKRKWQQIFREQQRAVQAKLDALTPRSRVSAEDLFIVNDWTAEAMSRLIPIYVALEKDVGQHTYASLGIEKEFIFTAEARKRIEKHAAELVTQVNQTTKRRIAKALSDGVAEGESIAKMAKRLDEVFGRRKRDTKTIARTEVGTGATRASIEAVKQSGSKRLKRWITARDAKVRDDHVEMEGVTVELDELFTLADGSRGEGPSDPRLAAGERINCRCSLIYPRATK